MEELNLDKYYSLKDIESITNRNYDTIIRWVKSGSFPPYIKIYSPGRCGGPIFWEREDIDKWLKSQKIMCFGRRYE